MDRRQVVLTASGHAVYQLDATLIIAAHIVVDFIVQFSNMLIQFVNVDQYNAQHFALKR